MEWDPVGKNDGDEVGLLLGVWVGVCDGSNDAVTLGHSV